MSYNYLPLDRKWLSFQQVKDLLDYNEHVSITFDAHDRIMQCREYLDKKMKEQDALFYGINTGFGFLQNVQIDNGQIEQLQYNLLKSHACGLGEEVPKDIVKLMLMLKIKSLSYGYSGVQVETVKRLMDMYNNDVLPIIYTQGSLGASGDLAPLSHLSLPLIGLGEVYHEGSRYTTEKVRPHKGQVETAKIISEYLHDSEIANQKKEQVQDPYSFRCVPQVHGATKDVFENVLNVFLTEINSVTDNPNIFPDEDLIVSGGNFHGQTLALHLDFLAIAISELANISERRIYQLISGQRGLPLFLVKEAGLNSGFMIPQYTAAGIVSENKQLCTPSSVDSISSSNNQEDHVSMGANAATKCLRVVNNVEKVLAIELLSAAQALDFRRPLKTSPLLEELFTGFRKEVSFNEEDRVLHDDMMKAIDFVGTFKI